MFKPKNQPYWNGANGLPGQAHYRHLSLIVSISLMVVAGVALPRQASAAPFDEAFIDAMLPHHQSAVAMAEMAVRKSPHALVRNLARGIIRDQQREIARMKAWRSKWYGSAGGAMGMPNTGGRMRMMSGSMMGLPMKMEMDMDKLKGQSGRAFEQQFLGMMVPHHASAISMATEALDTTARPEIRQMAHNIIDSQAKEIGAMRAMYRRWYGAM